MGLGQDCDNTRIVNYTYDAAKNEEGTRSVKFTKLSCLIFRKSVDISNSVA